MSKKRHLAAGIGMAVAVTLVASVGHASSRLESRLEWESDGAHVSWHHACAFAHTDPAQTSPAAHRFLTLRASLRSLARSDTKLYAVYLGNSLDLNELEELLRTAGAPPAWSNAADGPVPSEWVSLGTNGEITLRVDEANHPGNLVVVVNGAGEILGSHRLWNASDDLAVLHDDQPELQ